MKQIANVAEQDASHAAAGLCQIRTGLLCPGSVRIEEVIGQEHAKRALEVAIAGGHHILLSGPTGVGKTTLALAAASILPPLQPGEIAKPGVQLPVQLPMGGGVAPGPSSSWVTPQQPRLSLCARMVVCRLPPWQTAACLFSTICRSSNPGFWQLSGRYWMPGWLAHTRPASYWLPP